jgi:hypothetical protein
MSTNDFFAKIDKQLGTIEQNQHKDSSAADDNRELLEEIIARISSKVEEYAHEVSSRGISLNLNITKVRISFLLKYKDGGHRATILEPSMSSNLHRIEITGSFTNDDGKDYTSRSGLTYDRSNWKDELFISSIEKCIEDFLFYAPRHGGI